MVLFFSFLRLFAVDAVVAESHGIHVYAHWNHSPLPPPPPFIICGIIYYYHCFYYYYAFTCRDLLYIHIFIPIFILIHIAIINLSRIENCSRLHKSSNHETNRFANENFCFKCIFLIRTWAKLVNNTQSTSRNGGGVVDFSWLWYIDVLVNF